MLNIQPLNESDNESIDAPNSTQISDTAEPQPCSALGSAKKRAPHVKNPNRVANGQKLQRDRLERENALRAQNEFLMQQLNGRLDDDILVNRITEGILERFSGLAKSEQVLTTSTIPSNLEPRLEIPAVGSEPRLETPKTKRRTHRAKMFGRRPRKV